MRPLFGNVTSENADDNLKQHPKSDLRVTQDFGNKKETERGTYTYTEMSQEPVETRLLSTITRMCPCCVVILLNIHQQDKKKCHGNLGSLSTKNASSSSKLR